MRRFTWLSLVISLASTTAIAATPIPADIGKKVVINYTAIVHGSYSKSLDTIATLRKDLEALVATPNSKTMADAKSAWKAARLAYSRTEAFRFYGGPIDEAKNGPEGLINSWPIDEAYIDYVEGQPKAGIISNLTEFPVISKDILLAANEKNGEKNISTGFHAIEFLLWGQDLAATGPGTRPYSDYADPAKNPVTKRRGQYLVLLGELLEEHMSAVAKEWQPGSPTNYAAMLQAEPLNESVRKIYTGMTSLSMDEMAGERMTVALELNDQENEQDCFSDFSLDDLIANEIGIHQVYFGDLEGAKDSRQQGIHDLIKAVNPKLAEETARDLKKALALLKAIPRPFDHLVMTKAKGPKRKTVEAAIKALETQGRTLATSATAFDLITNVQ